MKKNKKLIDRLMNNRQFMLLFSIVAAFLFWLFVVANISPDTTQTINGVPVTINEDSGFISNAGLHVMEESAPKISVTVEGPRYLVGRLKPSDFLITPDLGPVVKSGRFNLKLNYTLKNSVYSTKVKIKSISHSTIDVRFDTLASKTLPVEVKVTGGSKRIANDYIMEDAVASPQQVIVTGSSAEVNSIAHAVVSVNINSGAKDTVTTKSEVTLYDSNNNPVQLKHSKIDFNTVSVTVPILRARDDVPFSVGFTNLPAGFNPANIHCTYDPATATIAGKDEDVAAVDSIKLQTIDFSTLDINTTLDDALQPLEGVTLVDNITSVSVTVNLQNTASRMMNTNNFSVINVPNGYTARVRTKQLNNIKLFGPATDIGSVTTLAATIDMSKVNIVEGQFAVPVTISVPGKTGYWVTGKYSVVVQLWKND